MKRSEFFSALSETLSAYGYSVNATEGSLSEMTLDERAEIITADKMAFLTGTAITSIANLLNGLHRSRKDPVFVFIEFERAWEIYERSGLGSKPRPWEERPFKPPPVDEMRKMILEGVAP